jgi:hypothetical protein
MVLRKLTLSEWFLRYQLLKLQKHRFYLPIELNLDVTDLNAFFKAREIRFPATALMVKLAALLQGEAPYTHRLIFPTLFGPRLAEATEPIVNLPIVIRHKKEEVLSAISIPGGHQKTLLQLTQEIKTAREKSLESYPIVKFVVESQNTFINRVLLRGLYYLAYCVPQNYIKRKGGGICVSSLFNNHSSDLNSRPYAFGPTALTLCFSSLKEEQGRAMLKIGIGYDHTAFTGNELLKGLAHLSEILVKYQKDFLIHESHQWVNKAAPLADSSKEPPGHFA